MKSQIEILRQCIVDFTESYSYSLKFCWKIFRQINLQGIFVFDEIFSNYTVEIPEFYCQHFVAKIPSNQLFTKEVYSKTDLTKKNCMTVNFMFFHTVQYFLHFVMKFCWISIKTVHLVHCIAIVTWFHGKIKVNISLTVSHCGNACHDCSKTSIKSTFLLKNSTLKLIWRKKATVVVWKKTEKTRNSVKSTP